MNYKTKLKTIDTFFFDVDGVFTNSIVLLADDGGQLRTANVRDGYAVQYAIKKGYRIVIISGGRNEAVRKRFEGLGVKDIFLGASDKVEVFNNYIKENNIDVNRTAYMGDDIPDYYVMQKAHLSTCPADAAQEIRNAAEYISPINGGEGCVRDLLEQTMKVQGNWFDADAQIW